MKPSRNHARLGLVHWAQYEQKLNQLDVLFQFVHYSFTKLSVPKRKSFVQKLKQEEATKSEQGLAAMRKLAESHGKDFLDDSIIESLKTFQVRELRANFRGNTHTQYAEWVMDGMTSAEILFRFTVFEEFMKHVHAEILNANPKVLASSSPTKPVSYSDVFSQSFDHFKEQQICREVSDLDSKNMGQRLKYFADFLGIDLKEKRQVLMEISDVRNGIAHGNPLTAITKDEISIPVHQIAQYLREIMRSVFTIAQSMYPKRFLSR